MGASRVGSQPFQTFPPDERIHLPRSCHSSVQSFPPIVVVLPQGCSTKAESWKLVRKENQHTPEKPLSDKDEVQRCSRDESIM